MIHLVAYLASGLLCLLSFYAVVSATDRKAWPIHKQLVIVALWPVVAFAIVCLLIQCFRRTA